MKEEFFIYTLSNGMRCVHRQVKSGVARCAVIINAGSRDEMPSEYGIAHFTEHGFFKGTQRRKAYQVNCRLEKLGGELNAFTTKEDTTIHATVLRADFQKAAELLSDVVFNSTFPQRELDKEREVILDEINTYRDSPMDMVYDDFEDLLMAGTELGHNILGSRQTLRKIDSQAIHAFRRRCHTVDQMVFSSIGNISNRQIQAIAERYFGSASTPLREQRRVEPTASARFDVTQNRHTHQTHCIIGSRACAYMDERRLPFALAVNLLGGPCANSRLNVTLREKYGLTYNIEASFAPYVDCGISTVYFSSDHENAEQCRELVEAEIKKLRTTELTTRQLAQAKKQFIAQLAIANEANEGYMLGIGKSVLVAGEVDTLEQTYRKIGAVTSRQILDVAAQMWNETSVLMFK